MAEEGTLCVNADVTYKAGANASATSSAEAYTNKFIVNAEGVICTQTRVNWVNNYASLSSDTKEILREAASSLAAMYVVQYDMSAFTTLAHAQTMLDVLRDSFERAMDALREEANREFLINQGRDS